jgi:hypothetical protein
MNQENNSDCPVLKVSKKKCAVFTIVQNENIFLPIWLKYYSKYFDPKDIYILNHDSNEESMRACCRYPGVNVVNLHHD